MLRDRKKAKRKSITETMRRDVQGTLREAQAL
jgi:hypothetical protein